jgi:hypothetical protein
VHRVYRKHFWIRCQRLGGLFLQLHRQQSFLASSIVITMCHGTFPWLGKPNHLRVTEVLEIILVAAQS